MKPRQIAHRYRAAKVNVIQVHTLASYVCPLGSYACMNDHFALVFARVIIHASCLPVCRDWQLPMQ